MFQLFSFTNITTISLSFFPSLSLSVYLPLPPFWQGDIHPAVWIILVCFDSALFLSISVAGKSGGKKACTAVTPHWPLGPSLSPPASHLSLPALCPPLGSHHGERIQHWLVQGSLKAEDTVEMLNRIQLPGTPHCFYHIKGDIYRINPEMSLNLKSQPFKSNCNHRACQYCLTLHLHPSLIHTFEPLFRPTALLILPISTDALYPPPPLPLSLSLFFGEPSF